MSELSLEPANGAETLDLSLGLPPTTGSQPSVRRDEFLGLKPLAAAKQYLKKSGQAGTIDEIGNAIHMGGAAISGSKWKEELEASLTRSIVDVIKIQDGVFGLAEFYTEEQIKGIRQVRRRVPAQKKRKTKAR